VLQAKANVRFVFADSEKDFERGHVPGSVDAYAHDLNYRSDVRKCKGLPMCEPTANTYIGTEMGIDSGTEVVVYDGGMGVNASGTWFFLKLYGYPNVKIMDGGLATWSAQGLPVETGRSKKPSAKVFSSKVNWGMIATLEEVQKASQGASNYLLVDARQTIEEFTGKTLLAGLESPGKEVTVSRGGSIPGAVFSPWTKYAGNKGGEANKPNLKDKEDLEKQLERLKKNGYDAKKTVISYCHVGMGRGSFQYLALKRAGHENVKVYPGSWNEWGNTSSLPLGKAE